MQALYSTPEYISNFLNTKNEKVCKYYKLFQWNIMKAYYSIVTCDTALKSTALLLSDFKVAREVVLIVLG